MPRFFGFGTLMLECEGNISFNGVSATLVKTCISALTPTPHENLCFLEITAVDSKIGFAWKTLRRSPFRPPVGFQCDPKIVPKQSDWAPWSTLGEYFWIPEAPLGWDSAAHGPPEMPPRCLPVPPPTGGSKKCFFFMFLRVCAPGCPRVVPRTPPGR